MNRLISQHARIAWVVVANLGTLLWAVAEIWAYSESARIVLWSFVLSLVFDVLLIEVARLAHQWVPATRGVLRRVFGEASPAPQERSLGWLGSTRALPLIGRLARESERRAVRYAAVEALGSLGVRDESVEILLEVLGADTEARIRSKAMLILGVWRRGDARPELEVRLKTDSDPATRATAAWALGALGDAAASEALAHALADEDATVRAAAAQTLGGLRIHGEGLAQSLGAENDATVRYEQVMALGRVGAGAFLSRIAQVLDRDPHSVVRLAAARVLRAFGEQPEIRTALQRAARSDASAAVRSVLRSTP